MDKINTLKKEQNKELKSPQNEQYNLPCLNLTPEINFQENDHMIPISPLDYWEQNAEGNEESQFFDDDQYIYMQELRQIRENQLNQESSTTGEAIKALQKSCYNTKQKHDIENFSSDQKRIQKTPKKYERKRTRDQNLCKKYHSLMIKVLRKMKINKVLKPIRNIKHRLEFFTFALILIRKEKKHQQFNRMYKKQVINETASLKTNFSQNLQQDSNYKNNHIIESIERSLESLKFFIEGADIEKSVMSLFNQKHLKNKSFMDQSMERVRIFYNMILIEKMNPMELIKFINDSKVKRCEYDD